MKWTLWLGIFLLVTVVLFLLSQKSGYAPPRDENTVLPYIEPSGNVAADSQSNVFMDAAGWLNIREHPLTDYFQEKAFSNVASFGDFVGLESSAGIAPMTVIPYDEQYTYSSNTIATTDYIPSRPSYAIPFIGTGQSVEPPTPTEPLGGQVQSTPFTIATANPAAAQPGSSTSQGATQ
jgi:hypothetical protein